ncbi:hypothetical protein PsYK624_104870 [Phanerochaete sordida]|uniref:DUF6697 domain-containing protein n=1 Tax=Phanerochaete sordida TaxID=48140 RepID=A0A9P3LGX8_9APHY|nr:hypothetical protein PsYK624_104870 [Phanerochaete sordida]
MDNLIRDPELAPQLFAVVNNNLQETRRALEAMKQDNDNLRAEVSRLQAAQVLKVDEATLEELQNVHRKLDEALETNQQLRGENSDLRSILAGWREKEQEENGADSGPASGAAGCANCDEARRDAERFQAELTEARDVLGQHARAYDELHERLEELLQQEQRSSAAREEQERKIYALQDQVTGGEAEVCTLKQRVQELETQLKTRDEEVQAKDKKLAEAEQRYTAKFMECDHQLYKLRQDLELTTQKYWRYKAGFDQLNTRQTQAAASTSAAAAAAAPAPAAEAPPPPPPAALPPLPPPATSPPSPSPAVPPRTAASSPLPSALPAALQLLAITAKGSSSAAPVAAQAVREWQLKHNSESTAALGASTSGVPSRPGSAALSNMNAIRQKFVWTNLISNALKDHCLPVMNRYAPLALPAAVKKHMAPGSTILSCPNRIITQYKENHIQLLAPAQHCKSAHEPLDFDPPTGELEQMIGSAKEVFFHDDEGIAYLGTYVGAEVRELSQGEFRALDKPMREAIIRHTFPSKVEAAAAGAGNTNRVRNAYFTGKASAQVLALRFVQYNKPFLAAVKAHAAKTPAKRAAEPDPEAEREAAPAKRVKKARLSSEELWEMLLD